MSFQVPKVDLGESNTPGRQVTQNPTAILPLPLGRFRLPVQWVTPVLHWSFVTGKTSQTAYFSIYGWVCCGPVDEIVQIIVGDKPYHRVDKFREDYPGTDYVEQVVPKTVAERFRFWWGNEATDNPTDYLQSLVGPDCPQMLGKTFPDDCGIFRVAIENMEAGPSSGGQTPPLPKIEIEGHRRSVSAYSFGYAAHGTHPIGIVKDLLTLTRGGRGLPASYFNDVHWTAQMQRLMDVGVATMKGQDLFISYVAATSKELDQHLAAVLEHIGGWLVERNGQLEIDWSPVDGSTIDEEGLRVITENELAETDVDEDPGDLDGIPSQVKVTGLDWAAENPLTEATESAPVPFVQRRTGEKREAEAISRPGFIWRPQLKMYATLYAAMCGSPEGKFSLVVLRQYAVQPDGVTPLRAGDLFVLNLSQNGGKRLVVRITERTVEDQVKVSFRCVRERGTFPQPAEATLDPRISTTIPPPADLARFTVAEVAPDLVEGSAAYVAPMIERPANSTVAWELDVAATNTWPGIVLESGNTHWAVGAVLRTTLGVSYAAATVTMDTTGIDWSTLRSQAVFEQEDRRLLAYHAGEWFAVGTITPAGDGSYTIGLERAVLGSLPAAHAIGAVVFFVYRADVVTLTHENFQVVEVGGSYDETTATKWFKARPIGVGGLQGNYTAAFSLMLSDPTPDAITGLEAITGTGQIVDLRWDPLTMANVNEYSVHRATGPGYTDEAQIGEAAQSDHPRYIDIDVTIGTTYRYRIKAHATGEAESAFSGTVLATPGAVDTYSPDLSAPAAPLAPVAVGGGTYLTDDGTVKAYATINLKALPAGTAIGQYLRWRIHGGGSTDPFSGNTPYYNLADEVVRIDDLSPGLSYDIAAQTFNINGVPSTVTMGTAFTSEKKTLGPNPPTALTPIAGDSSASDRPPPLMRGGSQLYACTVTFTPPNAKDVAYIECGTSTTVGTPPTGPDDYGSEFPVDMAARKVNVYKTAATACFVWLRSADFSNGGNKGAWSTPLEVTAYLKLPSKDLLTQNSDNVNFTGGSMSGMTGVYSTSSRRYKTNVRWIWNALWILWRVRGWLVDRTDTGARNEPSLIAEDVARYLPSVVFLDKQGRPAGIDYGKMVGLVVAGLNQVVILVVVLAACFVAWLTLR